MKKVAMFMIVVVVLIGGFGLELFAKENDISDIENPIELIELFYQELLSDKAPDECAKIFFDSKTASALFSDSFPQNFILDEKKGNEIIWKFLRENKQLFLFDGIDPDITVRKANIGYKFSGFARRNLFFDGVFKIVVFAPLSKTWKEGIDKEINFTLVRNDKAWGPYYLIDLSTTTINGIYLNRNLESERKGKFFKMLGFN